MSNQFSPSSLVKLHTCHPELQALMHIVLSKVNITILCGFRGRADQEEAYKTGHSRAQFGESPHNQSPSMAVDIAPYPIDWKNIQRFKDLAEVVKTTAKEMSIEIRWGGDFKSISDYPHFELAAWSKK